MGWSAKLIAMLLKILVYVGSEGHPSLVPSLHPPIDNALIAEIRRRYPLRDSRNAVLRRRCGGGVPITRIVTYDQYRDVVLGLPEVATRENCTLFEIESLWSARDAEEVAARANPAKLADDNARYRAGFSTGGEPAFLHESVHVLGISTCQSFGGCPSAYSECPTTRPKVGAGS